MFGIKTLKMQILSLARPNAAIPEAYLHSYFAPIKKRGWESYGVILPNQLKKLYKECNGLPIFSCISIYGIRAHYNRDLSSQFQPFDLKMHSHEQKEFWHPLPDKDGDQRFFFGSHYDGSGLYLIGDKNEVYSVKRKNNIPYCSWPDLKTFFNEEYDRLDTLHNRDGYLIDKSKPIIPTETA